MIRRALVIVAALAAPAAAFPNGSQFDLDPVQYDGAGGVMFDGAPRWTGHACDVCHTNPPGAISIRLEADPASLFTSGYQPGAQYHLRIVMEGETEGLAYAANGDDCGLGSDPFVPCDPNGFALELDDRHGAPQGTLATVDDATYVSMDGTAALHSGAHPALTSWDVTWTAPAAGTGTVIAYLAAVDGNGGQASDAFPYDTTGDDVAFGQVPIAEVGGASTSPEGGGCAAGGSAGLVVVGAAALLLALRGRRRRVAALALAGLASCAHVRPSQRAKLAERAMKFSPDTAEDELDLHMQEAREGSEGGYGTSGGGCGCN